MALSRHKGKRPGEAQEPRHGDVVACFFFRGLLAGGGGGGGGGIRDGSNGSGGGGGSESAQQLSADGLELHAEQVASPRMAWCGVYCRSYERGVVSDSVNFTRRHTRTGY
eukprot:g6299.t1